MIGLAATTYDPDGAIIVQARITNPYQATRRGSVTATLDGGVSVYDGGYSLADQTLEATLAYPSKPLLETLRYLVAYYGQVITATEIGVYTAILSYSLIGKNLKISLRLVSRLDS